MAIVTKLDTPEGARRRRCRRLACRGLHAEVSYLTGRSYQGVSARLGLRF